jgi:2-iminobutanoate/2-iminopropanoate deaminase
MNFMKRLSFLTGALLLSAAGLAQDTATEREFITVPQMAALNLPFADAVKVGNTLYISGRGGLDFETMKPPEDPREEAVLLMEDFKSVLEASGMTMADLVSVTIYCPDVSLYGTFNEVYRSYFEDDFPARAFIGSGELLFGMRFEMKGIAVK